MNHLSRFRIFSFTPSAIARLNNAGFPVIVVTNQSGVARGYFPESLVREVHDSLQHNLASAGARLDGIYVCPHSSADACDCRKPKIGMLQRAALDHHLHLARSFVVGDRYADMELAFCAGCRAILVRTGYGLGEETWHAKDWPRQPHVIVDTLAQAVDWILGHNS